MNNEAKSGLALASAVTDTELSVAALGRLLVEGDLATLSRGERRVIAKIAQHRHVTPNVNNRVEELSSPGERAADRIARFGGSWTFILLFMTLLAGWVAFNTLALTTTIVFDGYPFIFLNLMLSMVAALQAPIILMSQNRQATRDRIAAALDYEVNLKAELEIMALHDKLDAFRLGRLEEMIGEVQVQLAQICPTPAPAAK